jgi:hypothetical protein
LRGPSTCLSVARNAGVRVRAAAPAPRARRAARQTRHERAIEA